MAVFDPEAESEPPMPDRVPDELVARYGARARREVRVSRSRRYPLTRRLRRVKGMLRSGDLWLLTLLVFAWSVVAAGAVGALVYAALMFPWAGMFVVLPVVVLFLVSFGAALRVTRRQQRSSVESL
jgi:hypothetical protein